MKAVVVLSGGLDSATALYLAMASDKDCYAISFDYGQKHKKELDYAQELCKELRIPHTIVDLNTLTSLISNSALTGRIEVPEGHYAAENMKQTVVPNRNMIMYSMAIGYAVNIGAESVYVGVHAGDHFIYPDCRPEFIHGLEQLALIANEGFINENFRLIAPFSNFNKAEIVTIGQKLHVPFKKTWSCYKGEKLHCGKCGTCVERKEAFKLAGVKDPTKYAE